MLNIISYQKSIYFMGKPAEILAYLAEVAQQYTTVQELINTRMQ